MTDREKFEAWLAADLYGEDSCAFMRDRWGYVDREISRFWEIWQASRKQTLADAIAVCQENIAGVEDEDSSCLWVAGYDTGISGVEARLHAFVFHLEHQDD